MENSSNNYFEINEELQKLFELGAVGAIEKGKQIVKVFSEHGDIKKNGTKGIVKGSIQIPEGVVEVVKIKAPKGSKCNYLYAVQFEGDEKHTLIASFKIEEIK